MFILKGEIWTETNAGRALGEDKAETEVKLLPHKEQRRLLANHQKLREKPGTNPSYSPQKEATPADTLVWDFWLPEM